MSDTSAEVRELVSARMAQLSGADRFLMGAHMFEAARTIVLASFPPDLSEAERKRRLYERFYGEPMPTK